MSWSDCSQITNDELPYLLQEIGAFAAKTFPKETVQGKLEHLQEEVVELRAEPDDMGEWADCFTLLFDAARQQGLTFNQIANAILAKYKKNKGRTWVENANGVYHHVK